MKECKYRLPCNWCDRLNKYCDMVKPIIMANKTECEHDWVLESRYRFQTDIKKRWYYRYICRKCGAIDIRETEL